jgi:transposase
VRLVRETGKPIAQVARELGMKEGTLGNWVNDDRRRRDGGGGALSEDERAELARLRRENAELRMRCDVLKRSVALWVLSRRRDNTHYAEDRIMPSGLLDRLLARGSASR